ncbi:hypothetical protein BC937DRAFT_86725, partial [Endogone sp. FLAS-F59071]
QIYFSTVSNSPTGDWNEGFIFSVSYHAQLFDSIDASLSAIGPLSYKPNPLPLRGSNTTQRLTYTINGGGRRSTSTWRRRN